MMVLIVDDNEQVRRMIRSLIEDIATKVCECEDGCEAFSLYEKNLPDWVLMDVAMKSVGGLEAARQIKSVFPKAKIIIVTNFNDAKTRNAAFAAGACAFLNKENLFELRELIGKTNV